MVYEFSVLLRFEISKFVSISDKVVDHSLEYSIEGFYYKSFFDRSLVVFVCVECEEGIKKVPEFFKVVTEVFSFDVTHFALSYASVEVALLLAGIRRRVMGGLTGDVVLAFSFLERAR